MSKLTVCITNQDGDILELFVINDEPTETRGTDPNKRDNILARQVRDTIELRYEVRED